jgi:FKBP-type peptidyl-prolyl cis-trans isomerase FkpA
MYKMTKLLMFSFILSLFGACAKDQTPEELFAASIATIKTNNAAQLVTEDSIIKKYIVDKSLVAKSTSEGIYYVIEKEGSGDFPVLTSQVLTKYKGYRLDGKVFDESTSGVTFALTQVISGWTIGLQKFNRGAKGKLIIPSPFAYGSGGAGANIPGNTPLVFDIELVEFR